MDLLYLYSRFAKETWHTIYLSRLAGRLYYSGGYRGLDPNQMVICFMQTRIKLWIWLIGWSSTQTKILVTPLKYVLCFASKHKHVSGEFRRCLC